MVGEGLREAGTLVVVFAPLYETFEPKPHNWIMLLALLVVGFTFLVVGIKVERGRRD